MTRATSTFKKRDVTKAYKAIVDAGGQVSRIEVDSDGRIIVVIGKPGESSSDLSELDAWMAKRARDTEGN
jgi:hypothetical protein